ncbi:hypothetical protein GALMADRAFT_142017 [Galerina marginata CBS 339.88]|uniref:F-box domain-containing protein n=1 Tax=Galerina marginata (strain CBS 339.88) TaxID=685588 RepID=A0A067T0U3_GALM3|nr:hypothetical protein GALMADRAFT_142017 [Galerina marginata CBS 339.88]
MASATPDTPPTTTTPEDTTSEPQLPFFELGETEYKQVTSGPRISSCHSQPHAYYGPISIRNYIAGSTKKVLRTPKQKVQSNYKDVFLRLPIELKLLVLEHLHPIDIYHFSQVSTYFRAISMNPKAAGVWKTAFECHPDLPGCPPGVTARQWAFMLFGPGICLGCGKYGALTDFAFLKQYCELCMRENYSYVNALKDATGRPVPVEHIVCSLVPRSYRYHGLRYTTSYVNLANAKYFRKDFNAMMKKVTLIQTLINNDVPTLAELFEEYREALKAHVTNIHLASDTANTWAMEVFRRCSVEYDTALREITERCKTRLHNLGHETQDINYVQYSISHALRQDSVYKLTSRAFRTIRPKLESLVTTRKVTRIKNERQQLLENIYRDYQKTVDPDCWQYLPPARLVNTIEGFSEFINAPYTERGSMDPGHAVSLFPDFVSAWTKKQQVKTLELFPTESPEEDFETRLAKLELVTSVVTCGDCKLKVQEGRVLLGWKHICRHRRTLIAGYLEPCSKYEINANAKAAAASLVSCVGLDPATTTIQDMDVRNDRFLCGNCMSETSHGISGLKAYTWHECLMHSMEMHILNNVMHTSPAWLLLTAEATKFVKEHEYPHPRPISEIWRCNKCAAHYDGPVTQEEAVQHAKKVHLIINPVIGVDVAYDRRFSIRRRKAFRLGMDPAYEVRCKRCPDISIYKLWEMQDLTVHLRTKHQILDPVEGEDWMKINMIAAASAATPAPTDAPEQPSNP